MRTKRVGSVMMVWAALCCACAGGDDPRQAPGCAQFQRRCDGDILQICQVDASRREAVWFDVVDCAEYGRDIGEVSACMEQEQEPDAGARAECVELAAETGGRSGDR